MNIQLNGTETIETDTLSVEQLKELRREVDDAVDLIEHQIAMAKAGKIETGEYAPAQWMAKAVYALTRKRRASQRLMEEIGARRKHLGANSRALSEYFVDICREKMSKEVFLSIKAAAEKRAQRAPALASEEMPTP